MTILRYVFMLMIVSLINNVASAETDETLAKKELDKLNHMFGYRVGIKFSNTEAISANKADNNITINLTELDKVSTSDKKMRLIVLRFIISHEFAHHVQFHKYKDNQKVMNNDLMSKTLIETQADILGGFMLMKLSPELIEPDYFKEVDVETMIYSLVKFVHDHGIREHTEGTHPSKQDRVLSIRIGFSTGLSHNIDEYMKANPHQFAKVGITPEKHKSMFEDIFKFSDYDTKEDILVWSYRQAKKVVNYDRKIANDIVLTTPNNRQFKFRTTDDDPYVSYDLTYKNIGDRSIDVTMEVFVFHVKRTEPQAAIYFRKINVKHYKFTLAPGASITINDELLWMHTPNDTTGLTDLPNDFMPRLVYPGSATYDAMISCSYTNDSSDKVYGEHLSVFNFRSDIPKTANFSTFLQALKNAQKLGFMNERSGIGKFFDANSFYYSSSLQYDDESETNIVICPENGSSAVEMIFKMKNEAEVFAKFKELASLLDSALNNFGKRNMINDVFASTLYENGSDWLSIETIIIKNNNFFAVMIKF
ncbi:MAG: hypothetical protein EOO90_13225 [Pedobacter sp.]|nr:MAG: hypothetical protein EOO90_13225 [Pedobacter sp.]